MAGKISPDESALMRKMLQALRGAPVVPRHVANASFAIMCLALTKMEPHERDHLLATLNAAARSQVSTLLTDEDGGLKWH
jgi:hypothetical protein